MAKSTKAAAVKANTKARQVRELIRSTRSVKIETLMNKVRESNIGVEEVVLKRYVVNNLAKVQAERAANKGKRSKKKAA